MADKPYSGDDEDSEAQQYPVGYKKPPSHTRFKSGVSGNAKGRPKGSRNFVTAIARELDTRIEVTENGRRRKISKREAIVKQTVNKAAAGDPKATAIVLNEVRPHEANPQPVSGRTELTAPEDRIVMNNILQRIRQSQSTVAESETDQDSANQEVNAPNPISDEREL